MTSTPLPRSPLFPYTTLFRSEELKRSDDAEIAGLAAKIDREEAYHRMHAQMWYASSDRKSTRLNSSHTVSSYAVCCLKKKNKRRLRWPRRPRAPPWSAGRGES